MNYAVLWQPAAEARLADLWATHPDRQRIADAADLVDEILARDPAEQGESRDGTARLFFVDRLEVYYHIDEPARTVFVRAVRWAGR